ncbi:MAG: branched-chain amino acid aminotransferase [Acidobacteriota bacterium]|jgi:branched-chain amino acid aminotransferase|nr:branched-chain amino acid aminotransferase [Acidobacteriota bacterium]
MFNDDTRKKDVKTPSIAPEVWHDGEFIKWDDARVHVMSHVLHYGSSVFEGIRCYKTKRGPAVFRLREHIQRLLNSAKIYRMTHHWTLEELCEASIGLVARSGLQQCYIRPIMFRSLDEERPAFGVNPFPNPMACYIGAWDWGKYLGAEAIEQGVDVCVSSWNRLTPNSMPAMAKAGANYMNSQLIKMEALTNGYAEGIALDDRGYVSEGSGENIFLVHDGKVVTPPLASSILPGITRDSVIEICRALEIPLVESGIQRAALYVADELFFTGTAAEVTPIRSVDRIPVGEARRGPVTERIQKVFFEITSGEREAPGDWLTFVAEHKAAGVERNGHDPAQTREVRKAASTASTASASDARDAIHVTLTE